MNIKSTIYFYFLFLFTFLISDSVYLPNAVADAGEQAFVTTAAQSGIAEIKLAQLAQQKSSNPDVRAFADRIVHDHTMANEQLKTIAQQKNFSFPTAESKEKSEHYEKLQALSGSEFDMHFARRMVKDHKMAISKFESEVNTGKDPQLKQFADLTLPTLKEHLTSAEQIKSEIMTVSNTASTR